MKRVVLILTLAAAGLGLTAQPAQADGYWACVSLDVVDIGACLSNPYPEFDASLPQLLDLTSSLGLGL